MEMKMLLSQDGRELKSGSCRFGLWYVRVWWKGSTVHRVTFATTGIDGDVPPVIRKYCAGHPEDPTILDTIATQNTGVYSDIYRAVKKIPYGKTATYGEIAASVGTSPRVVGQAMARNPTALVIPCHRVVAASGIGGFTPPVEIKVDLLAMEKKHKKKMESNNPPEE